ncbi:hypothetical protein LCGC14_1060560 [marine sediment metagenome]|uniref:Uncharacterized protein n=1 Tax=marine sediment metagenome TaxID=412755 RepID=A0A0F9N871_9ZZZZ
MVTQVRSLINLAQAAQALALTTEGIRVSKKKKKTTKDILGLGVKSIVGVSLIRATGQAAGNL